MNIRGDKPLDYFNRWLAEPIVLSGDGSVGSVIDALNQHPLAQDETAQDYVMPPRRYREMPGRFRILGENQDIWYCFVYDGEETQRDPAVYFETCLDLRRDRGIADRDIVDDNHVMVCSRFTNFLWHMLGQQICIRMEGNGIYARDVHGVVFKEPIRIDEAFINPLGREFSCRIHMLLVRGYHLRSGLGRSIPGRQQPPQVHGPVRASRFSQLGLI